MNRSFSFWLNSLNIRSKIWRQSLLDLSIDPLIRVSDFKKYLRGSVFQELTNKEFGHQKLSNIFLSELEKCSYERVKGV